MPAYVDVVAVCCACDEELRVRVQLVPVTYAYGPAPLGLDPTLMHDAFVAESWSLRAFTVATVLKYDWFCPAHPMPINVEPLP